MESKMNKFLKTTVLAIATFGALTSVASAEYLNIHGRSSVAGGEMAVRYSLDGDLRKITRAELATQGIDIFDIAAVYSYMDSLGTEGNWTNFPTKVTTACRLTVIDPDAAVGQCVRDDGLVGSVGKRANRTTLSPIW
jgi:hypothetical protein